MAVALDEPTITNELRDFLGEQFSKTKIVFTEPRKLSTAIEDNLSSLSLNELLIVCFDHHLIHQDLLAEVVKLQTGKLSKRGYTIVGNHPDNTLSGLTNINSCGSVFVQTAVTN